MKKYYPTILSAKEWSVSTLCFITYIIPLPRNSCKQDNNMSGMKHSKMVADFSGTVCSNHPRRKILVQYELNATNDQ